MEPEFSEDYPPGYTSPRKGGGRLLGVLLFLAIIAASVAFFFLYTMKKLPSSGGVDPGKSSALLAGQAEAAEEMVEGVVQDLQAGNLQTLADRYSPEQEQEGDAARLVFGTLLGKLGYRISGEDPVYFVGGEDGRPAFGVELESPDGRPDRVTFETFEYQPGDWRIAGIEFPQELQDEVIAAATGTLKAGERVAGASAEGGSDPKEREKPAPSPAELASLATTKQFVSAALTRDYDAARQITDFDRVKGERIAALCFVFEEGAFQLAENRPIVLTANNEDRSWAVVKVVSPTWGSEAEFGVELEQDSGGDDAPWKVVGLNFSTLLTSYAEATDAGKVAYTPMIERPNGGESLLLYFEYDETVLHDRARRQLAIVAQLLRGDPDRRLQITGHADALGEEDYNVRLSAERASNVRDYLGGLGVSPDQVVTIGAGETAPLRPNTNADGGDNPEGRAHNRRAEIFLDFE